MKKVILMSLVALTMLFNAGCTNDEINAGIIGVAIGIGLGDGHHDHDHYRPGPYRPRRPYGYALQGSVALPEGVAFSDVAAVDVTSEDAQLADFAAKYSISLEAAGKVKEALLGVPSEGVSSLAKIGLSSKDIAVLMNHSLPSDEAIQIMAVKLDMSQAQTRDLLVAMNREFAAQAADVKSAYWSSCMAKGQWRTPQNRICKSTSWPGCSPDAGATLCY